jgi:uncharacterized protein YaiL (DUF2058 family)
VATIRGTQVDAYNRRLIELVEPDCVDDVALQKAAGTAVKQAFGANLESDEDGPEMDFSEPDDLEDE